MNKQVAQFSTVIIKKRFSNGSVYRMLLDDFLLVRVDSVSLSSPNYLRHDLISLNKSLLLTLTIIKTKISIDNKIVPYGALFNQNYGASLLGEKTRHSTITNSCQHFKINFVG